MHLYFLNLYLGAATMINEKGEDELVAIVTRPFPECGKLSGGGLGVDYFESISAHKAWIEKTLKL